MIYGYEAVADALAREGMEQVFAVAGSDTMELLVALDKKKVGVISTRKECGAVGMADGYYRVTEKPGVCSVTAGPGLANAATSLTTARKHQSPLICITTEVSTFNRRHGFYKGGLDQRRFAEATAGKYICVSHVETLAEDLQAVFQYIRSVKGPVVLAVPEDIMQAELDMGWEYSPLSTGNLAQQRIHPDSEIIDKAIAILREAERPVILVGRGASDSQAGEEIKSLAKRTGALLATTLLNKYYLADHPYNIGIAGLLASEDMHSLLSEADCVIAVGCSLNVFTTESGLLFPEAQIIHIDHNPAKIGAFTPVAVGIVGDARASLADLNSEMERQYFPQKRGFWHEDVKSRIQASRLTQQTSYAEAPDTIDPIQLVAEMDKILPRERIVVVDGGYFSTFVADGISFTNPSNFLWTVDFGSVGMGLYQGIGAAVGQPDKHVVVFTGDGGFMMTLEELDTAVRNRIPITVVVMNDNGFGAEFHKLEKMGKPTNLVRYDNPDFVKVAAALGAVGLTVRNVKDLPAVAEAVAKREQPVLVDAKINSSVLQPASLFLFARH